MEYLSGVITGIIGTLIIGYLFIRLIITKIQPRKEEPENLAAYIQMSQVNIMEALAHLPERTEDKNLQRWAIERIINNLGEALRDINFLLATQKIKLTEAHTMINRLYLYFGEIKNLYGLLKGPIQQKDIDLITLENELDIAAANTLINPVMERQSAQRSYPDNK